MFCCWSPGEGAGRGGLQLQLSGWRLGEDLWGLLVLGGESVDPVTLATQLLHAVQQGHAPAAATEQHAIRRLSIGETSQIVSFEMQKSTNGSPDVSPLSLSEFPSIFLRSWSNSRHSVHPQCDGRRPELHLHRRHELPAHHGVFTSWKVPLFKLQGNNSKQSKLSLALQILAARLMNRRICRDI